MNATTAKERQRLRARWLAAAELADQLTTTKGIYHPESNMATAKATNLWNAYHHAMQLHTTQLITEHEARGRELTP